MGLATRSSGRNGKGIPAGARTRRGAGRKARRCLAGMMAAAMALSGGAFGGPGASAETTGKWSVYSNGSFYSGSNIGSQSGPVTLKWDSTTLFSGSSGDLEFDYTSPVMGKLARDDVFSKSGYVYRGAAISSNYSGTPGYPECKLYRSAATAVSKQTMGAAYRLQPIMARAYHYDYNYSGGGTSSVANDVSFTDGSTYYTLDTSANRDMFAHDPARDGYTFTGWYTSPDGGSRVSEYSTDNQTTLYAHWTANSYNLSTINGSGINSVSGSGSYRHGSSVTVSASVSAGHHFTGWSGTYSSGSNPYTFTMPIGNVTLTANAAPNTHSLSFVVDGKVVSTNGSVPYGARVSDYAPSVPGKTGYAFSGWSGMPSSMPDHDVTVTGTYQANSYTITFISDGAAVKSASIKYGDAISSVIPTVNKPGYAFDGWYTAASGGSPASLSGTYQKAGDTTVYAHWTPLYQYDASSGTFHIYSQDPAVIAKWKDDGTVLGARKVVLGKGIGSLSDIPLSKFSNMEEIAVDSSNGAFAAEDGMLYSQDKGKLVFCPARHGDDPRISRECVTVGVGAFAGTSTVSRVALPYGVRTLEEDAFNTSSVKEIAMKAFQMDIGENAVNASTTLKVFQGSAGEAHAKERNIGYTLYTVIGDGFFEGADMESFDVPGNITAIGNEAFRSCTRLKRVSIPASVKSIGSHAFAGDVLVEELDLSGAEAIGENAFSGMAGLKEVALSEDLKKMGAGAFRGCTSLDQVFVDNVSSEIDGDGNTIPASVTVRCYAGSTALAYAGANGNPIILMAGFEKDGVTDYAGGDHAAQVVELVAGDGLKSIGDHALAGARLKEVVLPSSVEEIGAGAFAGCVDLERADLSESSLKAVPEDAFKGCTNLKEVIFNDSCGEIGKSAFEGCESLEEAVLPGSVSRIGEDAFKGCSGMERISIEDQNCRIFDSEGTIPAQAVIDGYANSTANVYGERFHREFASKGNAYIVSFDTQGGVGGTEKAYAVNGKAMPEIALPERDGWAFGGYFTSPDGGGTCYYDESGASVTDWDLTDGKTLYALWRPESHKVTFHAAGGISEESRNLKGGEPFGELPTAIRDGYLFLGWFTELEGGSPVAESDVMGEEDVTLYAHWSEKLNGNSVPAGFLKGNEEIREVTIPKGVTTICRNAFRGCGRLEKVNLPDTVTTIEEGAFAEDGMLKNICLDHVKELGDVAFQGTALPSLTLAKGCVHLGEEVFKDSALASVAFHSDVAGIPRGMFSGCEKLESVTIDSPASAVGESAFEGSGLKVVTLPRSIEEVGRRAFAGCAFLEKVVVENKDCRIFDSGDTLTGGAVVSGFRASTARDYAEKFDYDFEECGASFKVAFDADGGDNCQASWYAYEDEALKEKVAVPTKDGSAFLGYFDGDDQIYDGDGAVADASYAVKSDLNLKARWKDDGQGATAGPGASEEPGASSRPGSDATPEPGATPDPSVSSPPMRNVNPPKVGTLKTIGKLKYKVKKSARRNGTVSVVGVKSKKCSKISIPSNVKIDGFDFKVTTIGNNAFKGCKRLKYARLGSNISKIGGKTFYCDKKLRKVTIKSKRLKAVGKNALKGAGKKVVIRMPKSKMKAYRKLLGKKAGFTKTMKMGKLIQKK